MIEVGKTITLAQDLEERKQESLMELMKDPEIHSFVNDNHLDFSLVSDYWAELLSFEEDHLPCHGCQGIENCPKISKGLCKTLSVADGMITTPLGYCAFGKDKEKESQILSRFQYNNVSTTIALTNLLETSLVKNAASLSSVSQKALTKVLAYNEKPGGPGLFLYDHSGSTDKTILMAGLMNALARKGYKIGICQFPFFLLDMKASFGSSDEAYLNRIMDVPYLLLDGIGEENITNWSRDEVLLTILSYRALNNLPTFMTSMYSMDELKDVYTLKRSDKTDKLRAMTLVSKMKALCQEIMLDSKNL